MRHQVQPRDVIAPDGPVGQDDGLPPSHRVSVDVGDAKVRAIQLLMLGAVLLWLLFWYRGTVLSLVEIWNRSDTYAHGFLVAPIAGWLIWRRRDFLRVLPIKPSLLGLTVGMFAGLTWLLGELASVASVSQFALVGMILGLIWAVMGTAMVRAYAFPLLFLFFLVPFGEFLFPTMMDWTAEFIIRALRASAVPVYAEGRTLVIPSGRWQVVEGCSGVRYLIASVVVGSLYAYLNYRSMSKRLLFVAASIVVPVLANWLRAYGIVMLGHVSDNRIATGVDHLVYGWVFFGIVIMALFWIGARWQDAEEPPPTDGMPVASVTGSGAPMTKYGQIAWSVAALIAVMVWSPVLIFLDKQGQHGPVQFSDVPAVGNWRAVGMDAVPEWSPRYSGMRGQYRAAWGSDERLVSAYVGYYREQGPGEELINSENRVLISKDPVWKMTAYGANQTSMGSSAIPVRSTEMTSAAGRLLVWHTYWIGGRWTTSDYLAKFYLALSRLRGDGDDSAVVIVYTPFGSGRREDAESALEKFFAEMGPAMSAMLDLTMSR